MGLTNVEKGKRKSYTSYKNDRESLAKLLSTKRRVLPTYSESDAIRDALNQAAGLLIGVNN